MASECVFCRIIAGEIPSTQLHNDELIVAIRDIAPRAPTHILLLSREHIRSADELGERHAALLGRLYAVSSALAHEEGIAEDGYRVVTNIGRNGGQTVDHLHFHLMGGRPFSWPPG